MMKDVEPRGSHSQWSEKKELITSATQTMRCCWVITGYNHKG